MQNPFWLTRVGILDRHANQKENRFFDPGVLLVMFLAYRCTRALITSQSSCVLFIGVFTELQKTARSLNGEYLCYGWRVTKGWDQYTSVQGI